MPEFFLRARKDYDSSWAQVYTVMYTHGDRRHHTHKHIHVLKPVTTTVIYHWAEGVKFMLGGLPSSGRITDSLDRLDGMYGS